MNFSVFSTIVETETATTIDLEVSVSSAAGETLIATQDVTYTTELPAQTSYATVTVGTQTVVVCAPPCKLAQQVGWPCCADWLIVSSRAPSQWPLKRLPHHPQL